MITATGCAEKEVLFTPGHVSGHIYENETLAMQCIVPADWEYLTEQELLQLGGEYAKLYQNQFAGIAT